MTHEGKSLVLGVRSGAEPTKEQLALHLATKRFDELTTVDKLGSSLIGYNIIPVRLLQILSYVLCADAIVAGAMEMAPRFGVPLHMAVPLFIFYIAMEFVVKGINREFVVRSKFKDEELKHLALPGVFHEEVTKLIEAKAMPEVDEKIAALQSQLKKLKDDCHTLRTTYSELAVFPHLKNEDRVLLSQLKQNIKTICALRSRLRATLRAIIRGAEIEKSELKLVAVEGKINDLESVRAMKESVTLLTDRLSMNLEGVRDEVEELKTKLDLSLALPEK